MTTDAGDMSAELACHGCGYDVRAHPLDGICPECGTSVAESRRLAAIPLRPTWRESDPRWRRRVLCGVWILALLPLIEILQSLGWGSCVPVPCVFGYDAVRTLDETFAADRWVYVPVMFCVAVGLLFTNERSRRASRLDWTRRWGVMSCYVVLLLNAVQVLFITALVAVGIAAIFQSMPPKYQPAVTQRFVNVSTAYLRYGPEPGFATTLVAVGFSSIAMLLSCVPLFDAIRSSGVPRWVTAMMLVPLAFFALMQLARAGQSWLWNSVPPSVLSRYELYFWPGFLRDVADPFGRSRAPVSELLVEGIKWSVVLLIMLWLTSAQLALILQRRPPQNG